MKKYLFAGILGLCVSVIACGQGDVNLFGDSNVSTTTTTTTDAHPVYNPTGVGCDTVLVTNVSGLVATCGEAAGPISIQSTCTATGVADQTIALTCPLTDRAIDLCTGTSVITTCKGTETGTFQ